MKITFNLLTEIDAYINFLKINHITIDDISSLPCSPIMVNNGRFPKKIGYASISYKNTPPIGDDKYPIAVDVEMSIFDVNSICFGFDSKNHLKKERETSQQTIISGPTGTIKNTMKDVECVLKANWFESGKEREHGGKKYV